MNKEEIEKAMKVVFNETCKEYYFPKKRKCTNCIKENGKKIKDYIQHLEQKESILDKVTELIKSDIKTNMVNEETNTDGMKEYWRGCIDTEAEILEFIEGEKK